MPEPRTYALPDPPTEVGSKCHYCRCAFARRDLRPYGPGGAMICFPCMKADPAREQRAGDAFEVTLAAAEAMSPSGIAVLDAATGQIGPLTEVLDDDPA